MLDCFFNKWILIVFSFPNLFFKTGLTIFYTTHILSEAEYLCDEIAIIDKGKILTVDSPDALKNKFGKEKTIKIHLLQKQSNISSLLVDIPDYEINFDTGTTIIIHSEQSELILLRVLKIDRKSVV